MEANEPMAGGPKRGPAARRPPRTRPRPAEAPTPEMAAAPALIDVRPAELPEHLFRRLLGAYLGGAREFVVRERPTLRPSTRAIVRTFCRRTRSPEIVSEERDAILLRDLAFESPVPLERRLDQMGQLVVRFHREAIASWAGLPFGEDNSWDQRDDEIDREAWYLQRKAALRLRGAGAAVPSLEIWVVARSLERIADHAVTLGEAGRRLAGLPHDVGPLASLEQFHGQAMEHLEGVLATTDEAQANDLLDTGEALLASGRALSDRLLPSVHGDRMTPAAAAAVARILESIGRTIAYGQDIAQVVLDRSVEVAPAPRADPTAPIPLSAA